MKFCSFLIIVSLFLLGCTEDSTSWIDPHPTGNPAPVVLDIIPEMAFPGNEIDIYGQNFSTLPEENMILFGFSPGTVLEASEDHLRVQVPMINNKSLEVKLAVQGSEHWGSWTESFDTTIVHIDTMITNTDTTYHETMVDTVWIRPLEFTFLEAITAVADSVYMPYGIANGPNDIPHILINQASIHYSKGLYRIMADNSFEVLRTTYVKGNLIPAPDGMFYANNLRRDRELGWISSAPTDGSSSFSKYIKNVVQPSGMDIDHLTETFFITTLDFYEDNSYYIEDSLVVDITDHPSRLFRIKRSYIDSIKTNTGGTMELDEILEENDIDVIPEITMIEYSRAANCRVFDGYVYVTQAGNTGGAAVTRHQIIPGGLGEAETVLDSYSDIHYLEFDEDGNLYFVPEGSATLIRYNPSDGSAEELYPGDVVDTANFMCWNGDYLYLVQTNAPEDVSQSSSEIPGTVQKVYIGRSGYTQAGL